MIDLKLDLREFERAARGIGGAIDQVPFAIATAMNEAVKVARSHEIDTVWPKHVTVRNRSFLRASLTTEFATKRKLNVVVYDRLHHVELKRLETGGTKRPVRSSRLAIPSANVRRGSKGITAKHRVGAITGSFRKGNAIYQRQGRKGQRIKRMYTLAPSARIKASVPFTAEFVAVMRREMRARFGPAMQKAMRTRR